MDPGVAALTHRHAELAAELEQLDKRAWRLRADIVHLDAALSILGTSRSADVPELRVQHRPEWFAYLEG
jgi:hypothetical protein